MTISNKQRRYELDWIRVLAFLLLILFHTGMMFNTWGWHVKNNVQVEWIEVVMAFLHQWRMPILFFVSGAAVWFMMDKYSGGRFILERHKRLLLPLIFGTFFIVPPQVYFERLFQGQSYSFVEFYQTVLEFVPYPEGNYSWHHLWYIPYIFVYSLIMFPVFRWMKGESARKMFAGFDSFFARGGRVYLLFLPMALSEIILRPFWRDSTSNLISDWAQFTTMLLVFSLGFIMAKSMAVWDRLDALRWRSLWLGVLSFIALLLFWRVDLDNPPMWVLVCYRAVRMVNMWLWVASILGFARHYLQFSNGFLRYANEAVYPFYIIHQTITVIVGFYLAPLAWPVLVKFLVLAAATFGGCWLLLELLIKRVGILRVFMGLRWNRPVLKQKLDTESVLS